MDDEIVLELLRAFKQHRVRFAVVGAIAMNIHGLPRATADLDLFVSPDEENVACLRDALHQVFSDPQIEEITAEDLGGAYPAIQYVPPSGGFHIDILARLGDAFGFEDIEVELLDVEGTEVPVATPRMLYRMKKDTVRMQDRADAARLKDRFDLEES